MTAPLLPELAELEQVIAAGGSLLERRVLCEADCGAQRWPVLAVTLGNPDPAVPGVGFVHASRPFCATVPTHDNGPAPGKPPVGLNVI